METKYCPCCEESKAVDYFQGSKIHKYTLHCNTCKKLYPNYHDRMKRGRDKRVYNYEGSKVCTVCGVNKTLSEFWKDNHKYDGLSTVCKLCRTHSICHTLKGKYSYYKQGAKSRELEFNLTLDEFKSIVTKPCIYCGALDEYGLSGVDRIDSSKSYQSDNCVPCCKIHNIGKSDLPIKQYVHSILKAADYIRATGLDKTLN